MMVYKIVAANIAANLDDKTLHPTFLTEMVYILVSANLAGVVGVVGTEYYTHFVKVAPYLVLWVVVLVVE